MCEEAAGVQDVSVNLLKNSMVVSYDEQTLHTAGIVEAVENTGYGAIPKAAARLASGHGKRYWIGDRIQY